MYILFYKGDADLEAREESQEEGQTGNRRDVGVIPANRGGGQQHSNPRGAGQAAEGAGQEGGEQLQGRHLRDDLLHPAAERRQLLRRLRQAQHGGAARPQPEGHHDGQAGDAGTQFNRKYSSF